MATHPLLLSLCSCPFVDNCVGRDNYAYFMGFVFFLSLSLGVMELVLWYHWSTFGLAWWVALLMLYYGVMLFSLLNLFGFHLYISSKNLTTNESLNRHRYQYLRGDAASGNGASTSSNGYRNPYDRGVLRNLASRLVPTALVPRSTRGYRLQIQQSSPCAAADAMDAGATTAQAHAALHV